MASCPNCNAVLKEDYGMITCASCGVIVFIDMDGMAHFGAAESSAPKSRIPDEAPVALAEPEPELEIIEPAPQIHYPFDNEISPVESEAPADGFNFDPLPLEPEPTLVDHEADAELEPGAEIEGELDMNAMLGYAEPAAQESEPASSEMGDRSDPLGLSAYANSEISTAKDGLLTFRILISGIDSKELRESLREALGDTRFSWSASSLMGRIRKGVLRIDNVSPVKASILVNRIKRLPIQIRWEQYAITQMEGVEDGDIPDLGTGQRADTSSSDESF